MEDKREKERTNYSNLRQFKLIITQGAVVTVFERNWILIRMKRNNLDDVQVNRSQSQMYVAVLIDVFQFCNRFAIIFLRVSKGSKEIW